MGKHNVNANDNDVEVFTICEHEGRSRLVFTTKGTLRAKRPGSIPLWWCQPRSDEDLAAIAVWLGERRELWPAWRRLSECDGDQALADEIGRLWSGGIDGCETVMLNPGEDPREVALFAMLAGRKSLIVRHRFRTEAHRLAFTRWYLKNIDAASTFLLFEGCLIGPEHVARVMEGLAVGALADEVRAGGRSSRAARRAQAKRRRAA